VSRALLVALVLCFAVTVLAARSVEFDGDEQSYAVDTELSNEVDDEDAKSNTHALLESKHNGKHRGIFKKMKKKVKKVGKAIKKGAKKMGRAIKKVAKKAGRALKRGAKALVRGAKRVFRKLKKIGKKLYRGMKRFGRGVLNGIRLGYGHGWGARYGHQNDGPFVPRFLNKPNPFEDEYDEFYLRRRHHHYRRYFNNYGFNDLNFGAGVYSGYMNAGSNGYMNAGSNGFFSEAQQFDEGNNAPIAFYSDGTPYLRDMRVYNSFGKGGAAAPAAGGDAAPAGL